MTPRWILALAACATVDRIEGDVAVVEWPGGLTTDVPLAALPTGAHEGTQLRLVPVASTSRVSRRVSASRRLAATPPVPSAGGGWSPSAPLSPSQESPRVQP